MTNELQQAKGDFLTNPQKLNAQVVRQYLDPQQKATNEELAYFIAICKERNLNPFTKEVYFIKYGTQPAQIVVSKDAFMKLAEQNENYDGFEAGVMVETPDGEIKQLTGTIYNKKDKLLGGWAKVYRKDRRMAIEADAMLEYYNTGKSLWAKMPALMIRKVAIVSAMREAFSESVDGLYTSDEMQQANREPEQAESREEVLERKMKEIEEYRAKQLEAIEVNKEVGEVVEND